MREDNMYQVLRSTEFIIELMKKNEEEITNLFTDQIVTIGENIDENFSLNSVSKKICTDKTKNVYKGKWTVYQT
jgi:hypothetical protein